MNAFIKDITIENFKSIRHQQIEGCKKVNVFIGYPNVGKSNVLEAIGLGTFFQFADVKTSFSFTDLVRVESAREIFFEGNTSKSARIQVDKNSAFYLYIQKSDSKIALDFNADIFHDEGKDVFFTEVEAKLLFNTDFTVDKKSLTSLIKDETHKVVTEILKYNYNSSVNVDKYYIKRLLPPSGDNLLGIISNNSDLKKEISELFGRYNLRLTFDRTTDTIKVLREYADGTIFLLPYSLIADTLRRLIFYKAAVRSNENTTLVFEEPEAHMFPPYIRKFTSDIIFDKTNQFFIATHSPYVLEELMEEIPNDLAIYLVDYKNGETIIKSLAEKDLEEVRKFGVDLFFNLESYLKDGAVDNA